MISFCWSIFVNIGWLFNGNWSNFVGIKQILGFPNVIQEAAENYSPALIANYTYELVKEYNSFYQNTPVLNAENEDVNSFRIALSEKVAEVVKNAMKLLGVEVPNQM